MAEVSAPVETVTDEEAMTKVDEAPATEESTPAVDLSASFADLKRQQREMREQQSKFKDSVKAEKAKFIEELKSNPLEMLGKYGISFDQLANQALDIDVPAEEAPRPPSKYEQELEELKAWRAEQERQRQEAEQNSALEQYQSQVFSVIEQDSEKFELINTSEQGKRLYWDTVVAYHNEYGEAPNHAEIAAKVETHLYEQAKKLMSTKKFQPVEQPKVAVENTQLETPAQTQPEASAEQSVTISRNMTGQSQPKIRMVNNASHTHARSKFSQYLEEQKAKTAAKFFS